MTTPRNDSSSGLSTRAVWAGAPEHMPEDTTVMPVFHGVTYAYDDMAQWRAVATGERPGHVYSRNTNPTVEIFEGKLRALEGAEASTSFATGMAAVSNTLFALLAPGDRVVSIRDTYGGTNRIFNEFLPRWGVDVVLCQTDDAEAIEREVAAGCALLYLETPTNPTLKVLDLKRLSRAAHTAGAKVVVDNTFATPINQNPLALGADLVLHSATKFLGGHSDAMGGVICGPEELVRRIFHFREINGASLDAMSAFMLTRGMQTLELRVQRQNASAQRIAEFLADHPAVEAVHYPGLDSHPGHEVAKSQMRGFGGVLAFDLRGGEAAMEHGGRQLAAGTPRRQPGLGRYFGGAAVADQPRGTQCRRARRGRHSRRAGALLGRHRERRRPDRRPGAGTRRHRLMPTVQRLA